MIHSDTMCMYMYINYNRGTTLPLHSRYYTINGHDIITLCEPCNHIDNTSVCAAGIVEVFSCNDRMDSIGNGIKDHIKSCVEDPQTDCVTCALCNSVRSLKRNAL